MGKAHIDEPAELVEHTGMRAEHGRVAVAAHTQNDLKDLCGFTHQMPWCRFEQRCYD